MSGSRQYEHAVAKLLAERGAFVERSHFKLGTDRHGSAFVDTAAVSAHPSLLSHLAGLLATVMYDYLLDAVVVPEGSSIALGQEVAHHLAAISERREVFSIIADRRPDGTYEIGHRYARYMTGRKVAVVRDIVAPNIQLAGLVEAVRSTGGDPALLGCLFNRGDVPAHAFGVKNIVSMLRLEEWPADKCPQCQQGAPLNTAFDDLIVG